MGYRVEESIGADNKSAGADLVASRVNGESIEVLAHEPVPIGEWAAFELKLSTGDVFLEGMGRCEACASSGDGHRVRLGTLQFDVMNELMFERVHLAAESLMTGERTGEVDIAALEAMRKAELAPRPSPSVAAASPPKVPTPMSTPSWRPPPPMRSQSSPPPTPSRPTPSAPTSSPTSSPPPQSPSLSPPPRPSSPPRVSVPAPKISMNAPAVSEPAASSPPPPLPPPPAIPTTNAQSAVVLKPATTPAPGAKAKTVSGYPAPPPEMEAPVVKTPASFSPPSRVVSSSPKNETGQTTTRQRLEPLLLAMRRGGAARHLEDAEELAMELGLQALERIFGE